MGQRDNFVDVAKGIGILLIVCIHTEVFGVIGMPLTFIAVPVFFFMSGFYDRSEKPISKWLPKSMRTLVLPAVIWVLIVTAYIRFLGYLKDKSWGDSPFDWYNINGNNGPAWFLYALLYAKLLTWITVKSRLPKIIIGGASLLVGYFGIKINLPLFFDEGCAAFPLYLAGKYMYPYLKKIMSNIYFLVLGLVALSAFVLHKVSFTIVPISNGDYSPSYLLAIGLLVLCFLPCLWLSAKCVKFSWLSHIGQASLGIMLLHAPMCHTAAVVLNRVFEVGSPVWILCFLVAYIIIVALSYSLTKIIEKYCPILLGK